MKQLELLVIEDKEKHLEDAREYFKGKEATGSVKITYAGTLAEAETMLGNHKYDGIISDIFFPLGTEQNEKKIGELHELLHRHAENIYNPQLQREAMESIKAWREGKIEPPSGIYIVRKAKELGIPIVLNTDSDHHGAGTEPVLRLSREKDYMVPLCDPIDGMSQGGVAYDESNPTKPWKLAYEILEKQIIKRLEK